MSISPRVDKDIVCVFEDEFCGRRPRLNTFPAACQSAGEGGEAHPALQRGNQSGLDNLLLVTAAGDHLNEPTPEEPAGCLSVF